VLAAARNVLEEAKILLILPVYNEGGHIVECIKSLIDGLRASMIRNYRIVVMDGDSSDGTADTITREFGGAVQVRSNPERTVPYALNRAIEENPDFDFYIRIDAHAEYPINYVDRLILACIDLGADNVGAVLDVIPGAPGEEANAVASVLSSPFGVGNSHFRTGIDECRQVDTVPFGCFPRSTFERYGIFDLEMTRNQDDEFNSRIVNGGGKIFIIPDLRVRYYARPTIGGMARMLYQYGYFKPLGNKKCGGATSMRQFAPLIFLVAVALFFLMGIYSYASWIFLGGLLLLYGVAGAAVLRKNEIYSRGGTRQRMLTLCACFAGHVSYGFGYLLGIKDFLLLNRRPPTEVKITR